MKVYVITCGEYSDYRICAVTLDKENAEKLKKKCDCFDYTGAFIEEYDTDYSDLFVSNNIYVVEFDESGDVQYVDGRDATSYTLDMCKEKPTFNSINKLLSVYVLAENVTSAIKIAAERRAKFLAEQMGL